MLTSKEIRSAFIEFFRERQHTFVPSSPVVPNDDPTLLFSNAGMNQFKDIFLGQKNANWKRAANSQKCIRVSGKHNDLEEVGVDTYHHTFFEMLGNWSFDDYFKEDAIRWAWELLTEVYKINPDQLWVTVFGGDENDGSEFDKEAAEIWPRVTSIPAERVLAFGKKDNFWEMGDTGPCGPCSEIHIDLGPEMCDMKHVPGHKCSVNSGCARYIELWNLVFVQFNRTIDGKLEPLKAKYIDTGAGLERLTAVLQNKKSNYDTDLFEPIISAISEMSNCKYTSSLESKTDIAMRVIADHLRSLSFAITDGAIPGNDGRGYVLRRILRRASRFGRVLGLHEPFMYKLVPVLVEKMADAFPEIKDRADFVSTVIESEEESFGRTLDRGLDIFAHAAEKSTNNTIKGEDAFQLYDTYGFPLDLTELMARERGMSVDREKFDELMNQQRQRARAAQKSNSLMAALVGVDLPETNDELKYEVDNCKAKIIGVIAKDGYKTEGSVSSNETLGILLDKTCFYAEAGGQVGDSGRIVSGDGSFIIERTEKLGHCVVHYGQIENGSLVLGTEVTAKVDKDREACKKNHTATHLLQWALQKVLGDSVKQQGSLVCPDYLRFDFTYPKSMTADEIEKVENLVREKIALDIPVSCTTMPIDDAKKLGAMALFGEKYGEEVRVVAIGTDNKDTITEAFSKEFCGGTHIDRIGEIGSIKIIKEESVSAGVRRITALTGPALNKYLEERGEIIDSLCNLLKVPFDQIEERVVKILKDNKDLAKQVKEAHKKGGSEIMVKAKELLENAEIINEAKIVVGELPSAPVDQLRSTMDMLKKKGASAAVLASVNEGKVILIASVADKLIKVGLKAGDIVKEIAPIVDGGGGGKPQMAQAGGKNPEKINDCLQKAKEFIAGKIS